MVGCNVSGDFNNLVKHPIKKDTLRFHVPIRSNLHDARRIENLLATQLARISIWFRVRFKTIPLCENECVLIIVFYDVKEDERAIITSLCKTYLKRALQLSKTNA